MVTQTQFDELWRQGEALVLQPAAPYCEHAAAFRTWLQAHVEPLLTTSPSVSALTQAKVLTLDKYFEWRRCVPHRHKGIGGKGKHLCLFQVFEQTYEKIKQAELALAPAPPVAAAPSRVIEVKPEPAAPALVQVPALFLGEYKE